MAYIEDTNLIEEIKSLKISIGGKDIFPDEAKESVLRVISEQPTADVVEIPKSGIGDLSDGYHTFNELYHHRAILFSVICKLLPDKAWKSKLHDTGDMFDGMFIVGVETPEGQATYHYDIEPYWDMFKVNELEKAPKWDGHTPTDAINRIENLSVDMMEVVRCKECRHSVKFSHTEPISGEALAEGWFCGCHRKYVDRDEYCSYRERRTDNDV